MSEQAPAHAAELPAFRATLDGACSTPVLVYFTSAVFWLLIGTLLGIAASLKFDMPEWLGTIPELTFGRIRPAHLNAVTYGWASLAGCGCLVWLVSRLTRAPARWPGALLASAALWNTGLIYGIGAILLGYSQGVEWLEFPLPAAALVAAGFLLFAASILGTFAKRNVEHLYVSLWYAVACVVWFPFLYVIANLPIYSGVVHGAVNWWYGHNALGVWFTPTGLALAYYFIPKVIGRPVYSYYLSLLGFWAFALFYNWNGIHHLVGGPLPTWLQTISIVASVLMVIPVMAVAVNHHMTTIGHFKMLRESMVLRFTVFGAMCYTAVSLQGSLEAIRGFQQVAHFTHYTIGHAHLGVHAFLTMILFGAMYYIVPRVACWDWPRPAFIKVHFWVTGTGVLLYTIATCTGGWWQGLVLSMSARPFIDSTVLVKPFLAARTGSGILMGIGHFLFALLYMQVLLRQGSPRRGGSQP